jgi:hypothetical protein
MSVYPNIQELADTVASLNEALPQKLQDEGAYFSLHTSGYADVILFGDIVLWSGEDDERDYDDDDDDYAETVEEFVTRRFRTIRRLMAYTVFEEEVPTVTGTIDKACEALVAALNLLPGVETTECCCGHGKEPFRIWLRMDSAELGAVVLSRVLSGRYYNYAPGEQRLDPVWRLYLGDTEAYPKFVLEGKPMPGDDESYEPAVKLAANINEHVEEDYATMKMAMTSEEG